MKTVGAAKFKEQCLALLDRLDPDGLVITKHGKPVAKLSDSLGKGMCDDPEYLTYLKKAIGWSACVSRFY